MQLKYPISIAAVSAMLLIQLPTRADEGDSLATERIRIEDRLPYAQQPIDYNGPASADAAARLAGRIDAEEAEIEFDDKHGYLLGVLSAFGVPVESQLLVFSKTALHPQLVGPTNPRAMYFNDEVSVTWTPGSSTLEIAADDPHKGPLFYVLHQDAKRAPRPVRTSRCLTCHVSSSTLQVPGWMLRSFSTDERGKPLSGYGHITHATQIAKRWGGWFVTGTHGTGLHRGNRFGDIDLFPSAGEAAISATDFAADFDLSAYPSPHSDLVAHLVLDHQVHGKNLITRVAYESRLNRHSDSEEQLVRYLLFADEAPLPAAMSGTSGYARWFESQGPFDAQGRSLREFDLEKRLFRYRLSYLIYSAMFDGLPDDVKRRLYRRLWQVLSGADRSSEFLHLQAKERTAIIEIIRATKNDLPESGWLAE